MLYWTGKYKVLGMTWGIVTLASIVSTVLAFYLKARKRGDSGAPLPVQGSNL